MTKPERTCIGCRRKAPAAELVRFRSLDGKLVSLSQAGGRGVWLCRAVDCLALARKRNAFQRSIKTLGPSQDWEEVQAALLTK